MKQDEVRRNRGKKTWQYSTMQWKCFLVLLMHLCYSACKRPWLEKWLCACFNQWHALHNCIKPQSGSQFTLCCVLFFSPLRDFPRGCSQVPESSTTICTCAGQSHLEVQGGGGLESLIQEGRQSARLWHHTLYAVLSVPGNKRHLFFRARLGKKPSPSRLAWLDSCRVLCCANCNLAGVGGDTSHWYCQSPCFPITIACTPTWLPDWQCYFRGNYYDSDYVNHSALCSALHQIAAARAARFFYFFISPHVSDGCLRYILSFLQ